MKKLLPLFLGLVLFIYSHNIILAGEEDYSFGPTVTNISGPTAGVVGDSYTFSANVTSGADYPIEDVVLAQTTNIETSQQQITITWYTVGEDPETCTTLECPITGSFTPSSAGTYYIHITVNFGDETDGTSCNTHPSELEANCLDSRGKYITFVVVEAVEETVEETTEETTEETEEEILPETATIPTRTYILVSTGLFLLLSSSQVKKVRFDDFKNKKREKFEKKFE